LLCGLEIVRSVQVWSADITYMPHQALGGITPQMACEAKLANVA
jgi:hypothetical protein